MKLYLAGESTRTWEDIGFYDFYRLANFISTAFLKMIVAAIDTPFLYLAVRGRA